MKAVNRLPPLSWRPLYRRERVRAWMQWGWDEVCLVLVAPKVRVSAWVATALGKRTDAGSAENAVRAVLRAGISARYGRIGHVGECRWLQRSALHMLTEVLEAVPVTPGVAVFLLDTLRALVSACLERPPDTYEPCSPTTGRRAIEDAILMGIQLLPPHLARLARCEVAAQRLQDKPPPSALSRWHERLAAWMG